MFIMPSMIGVSKSKSYLDRKTITIGTYNVKGLIYYGFGASYGNISPNTASAVYPGNTYITVAAEEIGTSSNVFILQVSSNTVPNSGWTTLTIANTTASATIARASAASFSNTTSSGAQWQWNANTYSNAASVVAIAVLTGANNTFTATWN